MFCPQCGSRVREGAKFCSSCGASLRRPSELGAAGPGSDAKTPASAADPAAGAAEGPAAEPKAATGTLMSFMTGKRQVGKYLVPNFVVLVACILAAAGVAYAAFMLYKNVIEPSMRQPEAQEQPAEEGEAAEPEESEEEPQTEGQQAEEAQPEDAAAQEAPAPTYGYEERSATASVASDPLYSPGERTDIEYAYPVITTEGGNEEAVAKINAAIKASIDADVAHSAAVPDTVEAYRAQEDASGMLLSSCTIRKIVVSYMDDSVVCLRDYRYDTAYGAHGDSLVSGVVFDLKTGDTVDALTLFGLSGEDFKVKMQEAVAIYASNNGISGSNVEYDRMLERCLSAPKSYDDIVAVIPGCSAYYVSDEGLVFHTGDYELGSYAAGTADVVVMGWEDSSLVGSEVAWDDWGGGHRKS